jgi:hypothetical protein
MRSSVDGFSSDLVSGSQVGNTPGWTFMNSGFFDPAFTQAASPIEFRLYLYTDSPSYTDFLRLDDLIFYGSTTNLPAGVQQLGVYATADAAEPSTAGAFALRRGGNVGSPLTVNYTLGGTAVNGVDYQTLSGTTNFAAGVTNIVVPIVPIDNNVIDPGKNVVLTLAANAAYTLVASSATVAITDDDAVSVSVTNSIPVAYEAGPVPGEFKLSRVGKTNSLLTVYYTLTGTATNGVQYQMLSGSASFAANSTTATIPVTPIADGIPSLPRTVVLTLTTNPGPLTYLLAAPTEATVTIIDDNDAAQLNVVATDTNAYERVASLTGALTIERFGNSNSTFTAGFVLGGAAVLGVDYTASATGSVSFAAGEISRTIVIAPIDNSLLDGDRPVILTLQSGSGYSVGPSSSATTVIVDDELPAETVFWSDNFDSGTSGPNYSVVWYGQNGVQDYLLDYGFDYGVAGITNAPGSTNTVGLKLTANKNDALASTAAVNAYPNGQFFTNDFALRFNLLCNYGNLNGEKVLFGINHSGTATNYVNWIGANQVPVDAVPAGDGIYAQIVINFQALPIVGLLAVTNGSSPSMVAYAQPADLGQLLQSPPFGAPGTLGNTNDSPNKTWVGVELGQVGNVVTLKLNNTTVLQFTNTTAVTNGNVMLGYNDQFPSIGSADGYALIENARVVRLETSVTQPVITQIDVAGGTVTIDFTGDVADLPGQFKLQSSATVNGTYVDDLSAGITGGSGSYQATTAASGQARYYRIRR